MFPDMQSFVDGKWSMPDSIGQRFPLNKLEHEETRTIRFVEVINACDIRMVQGRPHTLPTSTTPRITFGSLGHTIHLRVNRLPCLGVGANKGDSV